MIGVTFVWLAKERAILKGFWSEEGRRSAPQQSCWTMPLADQRQGQAGPVVILVGVDAETRTLLSVSASRLKGC